MQLLKRNISVFSAYKVHDNTVALVNLLKENSQIRSFADFKNAAFPIVGKYNVNWLEAEYTRAVASGRMAYKWQQIERTKALYPNLKYMAIMDDRTRDDHRALNGKIYPVDHSFWNTYYPPNGWRCRCNVLQTDQPVDMMDDPPEIPKDFRNNVGKTGDIYKDHPYYKTGNKKELKSQSWELFNNKELSGIKTDAMRWAKKFQGMQLPNKALNGVINVSSEGLTHSIRMARNLLPLMFMNQLPEIIQAATYDGFTQSVGKKSVGFHSFIIDKSFSDKNFRLIIKVEEYLEGGVTKYKFYDMKIKGEPE